MKKYFLSFLSFVTVFSVLVTSLLGRQISVNSEESSELNHEEITTEVVVVGGGGSGLTAAVTAAQNGKDVVVLEKLAYAGGAFAVHSDGTIRLHNEEDSEFIGSEDLYERWTAANEGQGNDELIRKITEMVPETLNWAESFGLELYTNTDWLFDMETVTLNPEGTYEEGMGKKYTDKMLEKLEEFGGEIHLKTTGKSVLINENGEAIGVVAEKADGSTLTVNADSVIIATGGFAAQVGKEETNGVIDTFLPELSNPDLLSEDHPASDGSGIMMAVEAGSGTQGLSGTGVRGNFRLSADKSLLLQNALFVNQNGERFANEGMQYEVFYTALANNYQVFEIMSANNVRENIDGLMETGTIHQADTLDELAEMISVDPEIFVATVERYNEIIAEGDSDFNKGEQFLVALENGPYYASETFARIAGSIGGILIDENTQVLTEDGTVIPNLYACGDAANGVLHDEEYVGGGSGTTFALNTGRLAGLAVSE